jgi:histidine triad (HIT) family protein
MKYDKNNIFYKIINKEVEANVILEGEHYVVIHDIAPRAPVHMLVIPKGDYVDYRDFIMNASSAEVIDFNSGVARAIDMMKLGKCGFRLISNAGEFGKQEVMHMHVHVLGDVNCE